MLDKYERTKRIVIMGYVFTVTIIMWGVSQTNMSAYNQDAFIRFAFFFWGSGFAFHYLSLLLSTPATKENWCQWRALSRWVLGAMGTIGGVIFLMLAALRVVKGLDLSVWWFAGASLALFAAGVWGAMWQAAKFREVLIGTVNESR